MTYNANLKYWREQMSWEYLGYIASALLVASLTMSDVVKLRWFNLAGCVAFTFYGIVISAWPVAITNGVLTFVNIYHLVKLSQQKSKPAE
ncbi:MULTISPECIES: YgjV family protein [unclassified Pseudoalteromonas]|uniref:YgjV family protein n=1 Tax=unclassified Pseudoalteromonas TaxID=194690 RepID=UPI0025B2A5A3|nr:MULTISPECIES: YgjV family protein [unclassified Pseudoalteromonas]MDN3378387.1 YgjV family protein [Pseudoalteromonas sp. APC 3893]MDN3386307.1 YgjV family protein [Pseudoalteromonas sp. APC 4017]